METKPEEYFFTDKKLEREYIKTRKSVEDSEPSIVSILKSPILEDDKKDLFRLFEAYGNIPEINLEKIELGKRIDNTLAEASKKYKKYHKYTPEQHENFKKEIESLEEYDENEEIKYKILSLQTSENNKKTIYSKYKRLSQISHVDDEYPKLKNWLDWSLRLPYDKIITKDYKKLDFTKFLQDISKRLDKELYGMEKVKEQILLFLTSRYSNPKMKKCSLGLLGSPGTGKTTIIRLLSQILDYPLYQISLGGVSSPEFLTGHQYTYVGSEPGEIVKGLVKLNCKNGILFFDEYDKISKNKEVCSALLHITDNSQNDRFTDSFLSGLSLDLSQLWFMYSMNYKPEDNALSDRIFYINIEPYTEKEKIIIAKDYILKKSLVNIGLKEDDITFSEDGAKYLVENTENEIRGLEYTIGEILNKLNFIYTHQNKKGETPGFKTSFKLNKKLQFPFILTKEILENIGMN